MLRIIRSLLGRRWVVALSAAALVGCSVHPIPYDVTRVSTYEIVQKIRCEAKEGLGDLPIKKKDHPILKLTEIGFDFTFNISEDNDLEGGIANLHRKGFLDGKLAKWDIAGSATRKRENSRQFRILETFEKLSEAECAPSDGRRNWIYPIVGSIGMKEVVETYLRIEGITDFGGYDSNKKLGDDSIVFSDKLDYTTEFGGSVTPTLELATVAGKFRLTKATIMGEARRKDVHTVTVALAQDGDVDLPSEKKGRRRFGKMGPAASFDMPVRRSLAVEQAARLTTVPLGQSRPGARALDAAIVRASPARIRVIAELERRRLLSEEERIAERLIQILRPDP